MSENDGGDFGSFLAGFVIGGLVGGAVALVLAPRSGAETRSQITGRGRGIFNTVEEGYASALDSTETFAYRTSGPSDPYESGNENQSRIVLDEGLQVTATEEDYGNASSAGDVEEEAETGTN
jgi:hypothetical protein